MWQSQRSCGHRGQCRKQNRRRVILAGRRGESPLPSRGWALSVTYLRASRTVSQIKLRARFVLRRSVGGFGGSRRFFGPSRGQLSLEDVAFMCQSQRSCGQRGRWFWLGRERVIPPRKGPPILPGKQRASSGGYPRGTPLGSLLHPFLERKGCARPGMRGRHPPTGGRRVAAARSRCGVNRNSVACDAAVVSTKQWARHALRRSA